MPMNKQTYICPTLKVVDVSLNGLLCGSLYVSDEEVNTSGRTSHYKRSGWDSQFWNSENKATNSSMTNND